MLVNSHRHNICATLYCFSFLFKRALPCIQLPLRWACCFATSSSASIKLKTGTTRKEKKVSKPEIFYSVFRELAWPWLKATFGQPVVGIYRLHNLFDVDILGYKLGFDIDISAVLGSAILLATFFSKIGGFFSNHWHFGAFGLFNCFGYFCPNIGRFFKSFGHST